MGRPKAYAGTRREQTATNAIKHGYEEGKSGEIQIIFGGNAGQDETIIVDDDGLFFLIPNTPLAMV